MNTNLVFAEYTPMVLLIIMTIMMIEAAGSVDTNTMTPLPGIRLSISTANLIGQGAVVRCITCIMLKSSLRQLLLRLSVKKNYNAYCFH